MKMKTIVITIIALIVPLMAVGYAAFQQKLVISGTSHVDSNWQIEIISVTESDIVGDAKDKVAPSYTGTTAKFKVSLINPTDSITYNIKIKNLGTLDARIKKLNIDIGESDAIIYDVNLVKNDGTTVTLASNNEINQTNINNTKNTTLSPNEEQTVKLKVTFKEGYIGQPSAENSSNTIKMTIDYVQNFKDSNGNQINNYNEYNIGDKITFAGSNWYVIEDSDSSRDYVTLLKENVLTTNELTKDYARTEVGSNYGSKNTMAYYWSDTCYYGTSSKTFYYGNDGPYNSKEESGCSNVYANSKIKEYFDNVYLLLIDSNNNKLKDINGYKIRLINDYDLVNLGYEEYVATENTPRWVYTDFSSNYYWTMIPHQDNIQKNGFIFNGGTNLRYYMVNNYDFPIGVRPVINLLKSAIE